jgi:hypothetical protein
VIWRSSCDENANLKAIGQKTLRSLKRSGALMGWLLYLGFHEAVDIGDRVGV